MAHEVSGAGSWGRTNRLALQLLQGAGTLGTSIELEVSCQLTPGLPSHISSPASGVGYRWLGYAEGAWEARSGTRATRRGGRSDCDLSLRPVRACPSMQGA